MYVADLHCDLLSYLALDGKRTVADPQSNCALPDMRKGGVGFQALAIYTETGAGSADAGAAQFAVFKKIGELFKPIEVALALENASGVVEEDEGLEVGLERLEAMMPLLYVSLTWKAENRFGGGDISRVGLKRDGEVLLDFLSGKKVAIDLSHTSDALAYDILNYIDKKGLALLPIASHSNYRSICDMARNLPDELAREIMRKKGVIGLNFVRKFVGARPEDFMRHIEHALKLGGAEAVCLGADFFAEIDSPPALEHLKPFYFAGFDNAGCYQEALRLFEQQLSSDILERLAYKNLTAFRRLLVGEL